MAVEKRKRIPYTHEEKAEFCRLIRCGFSYAEIGERVGVSRNAIRCVVQNSGLLTDEQRAEMRSRAAKARAEARSKRHLKNLSAASLKLWQDESYRRKCSAAIRAARKTERWARAARAEQDRRRGFHVPDDMRDEYQRLRIKLRSKDQAGIVLGLVTLEAAE